MALALYVGTLTEYFGAALRAHGEFDPPPSDADVRARVLAWRDHISRGLVERGHLERPLRWDESAAQPGRDVPIDFDDLRALKLTLAYAVGDAPEPPPDRLPAQPERDPRWDALAASDFRGSGHDHVLVPELWLPAAFAFTFACPYPDGHEVQAGSLDTLHAQLLDACSTLPIDCGTETAGVDASALRVRAGCAANALQDACGRARASRLPMLLHA